MLTAEPPAIAVYRSRFQLVSLVVIGLIAGAIIVAGSTPGETALTTIEVLGVALVVARGAVTRVKTTPEGIEVRNFIGSRRMPWNAIDRFRVGRYQLLGAVCLIMLKDGTTCHAWAIQASNLTARRSANGATRLVELLNERLAQEDRMATDPVDARSSPAS